MTKNVALKTAIAQTGKKQQRVADLAHVDRSKLSHVVSGRRRLAPKERERLQKVLTSCGVHVSMAVLFPEVREAAEILSSEQGAA